MLDEMRDKRAAYQRITENLNDENELPISDLDDQMRECLTITDSKFRQLKDDMTSIPKSILIKFAKKSYPYNLLESIIGSEALVINFTTTNHLLDDMDKLLDNYLDERESLILRLRFINGMTLEKIAEILDITRERVRQLESKAIRKLQHVINTQKLLQSSSIQENEQEIEKQKRTIAVLESQIHYLKSQIKQEVGYEPLAITNSIIQLGLINRNYNKLSMSGIQTVEELLNSILTDEIHSLKSMGMNSVNDILYRLHKMNYLESFPNDETILNNKFSENIKKLNIIKEEIKTKYGLGD